MRDPDAKTITNEELASAPCRCKDYLAEIAILREHLQDAHASGWRAGRATCPSAGVDLKKRALDWILSRFDESGNEDDAAALVAELIDPVRRETIEDGRREAIEACAQVAVREQAYWSDRDHAGQAAAENIEWLIRKLQPKEKT